MKVTVDRAVCCSYGMCIETAPGVFAFGEDGKVEVADLIPPELEGRVRFACEQCPTQALSVDDD